MTNSKEPFSSLRFRRAKKRSSWSMFARSTPSLLFSPPRAVFFLPPPTSILLALCFASYHAAERLAALRLRMVRANAAENRPSPFPSPRASPAPSRTATGGARSDGGFDDHGDDSGSGSEIAAAAQASTSRPNSGDGESDRRHWSPPATSPSYFTSSLAIPRAPWGSPGASRASTAGPGGARASPARGRSGLGGGSSRPARERQSVATTFTLSYYARHPDAGTYGCTSSFPAVPRFRLLARWLIGLVEKPMARTHENLGNSPSLTFLAFDPRFPARLLRLRIRIGRLLWPRRRRLAAGLVAVVCQSPRAHRIEQR